MERRAVNRYFKEIIRALDECEIKFQKNLTLKSGGKRVGVDGWYNNSVIKVKNTERINFVLVLIHEALHHIYPDWPEVGCDGEPIELFARELICEFSTVQTDQILLFLPKAK